MLSSLFIKNVAVIEEAAIDLSKGFTALTGETGAGKSIIIDSISLVLGQRISKDIIRTGCDKAFVTALFTELNSSVKTKLDEFDISAENDELVLYREIRMNGKSICKINSIPVTVSTMKEIGQLLIAIQGQHDTYELLSPEVHGEYLDNYGQLNPLLNKYQESFDRLRKIKNEIDKLTSDESFKERRMDLLKYQIEELLDADIKIGEKDELTAQRKLIRDSKSIADAIEYVKSMIDGDTEQEGMVTSADLSAEKLEEVVSSMPELNDISVKIRNIEYALQDVSAELRKYESEINFSTENLTEIENRLDLIYKISIKYGENEEEILKNLEMFQKELSDIELSDEKIDELSEEFEIVKTKAIALAKELSQKRKNYATEFSARVQKELEFLNMPNVRFSVELERTNLYAGGCDKVYFMVSTNRGEELKPITKVASGGELSRIMLAVKTVLSVGDEVDTMIFDEIDAGISGEAANKVGKKLKQASENKQIICITHLAQIAAMGDNHLFIDKKSKGDRTFTVVNELDRKDRVKELARIISGNGVTELKLRMAEEMLI